MQLKMILRQVPDPRHRGNPFGVVAQEGLPSLQWRSPVSCHILGDRGLSHIDAELEEFAMDPGSAPERVGEAHVADQLADFQRDFWSADSRARLPSPEQAKPGPMPANDRLRFDDHQGVLNAGCDPIQARKNEAIKIVQDNPFRRFSAQHIELMAQRHNLRLEHGPRPEKPGDQPPDQFEQIPHEAEHRPIRRFTLGG